MSDWVWLLVGYLFGVVQMMIIWHLDARRG